MFMNKSTHHQRLYKDNKSYNWNKQKNLFTGIVNVNSL